MGQALYRTWRPDRWEDVLGQEHITRTLRNAVVSGRVAHAYLFAGPRGTGKTTTARLLAKAVNCLHEDPAVRPCNQCEHCQAVNEGRFLDLIEIDAASNNGVDDVRELRDKINFSPSQGSHKVYIIDEVHMLSTPAFNALLKTLEEPPDYAIFILATTEIHKIPATVLSRCQRHEFRRLPVDLIVQRLTYICEQQGIQAEPAALLAIARQSAGGMRDAISLLDQMASAADAITLQLVQTVLGTTDEETIRRVVESVLDGVPADGLLALHQALDRGSDPRSLARQIVGYLRQVLLLKMDVTEPLDLTREALAAMQLHAERFEMPRLLKAIRAFNQAANAEQTAWEPALGLELALAESLTVAPESASPAAQPAAAQAAVAPTPSRAVSPLPKDDPGPGGAAPQRSASVAKPNAVTLEQVRAVWKAVKDSIRREDSPLNGLLNSASLVSLQDGVLVLGMPSEILREKISKPEKQEILQRHLEHHLGVPLRVQYVVGQAAVGEEEQDDMVAAALRLGGKKIR